MQSKTKPGDPVAQPAPTSHLIIMAANWTWTSSAEEQAFRAADKEALSRTLLSLERYAIVKLAFLEQVATAFSGRRVSHHEIASKLVWTTKFTRDEAQRLSWLYRLCAV